MATVSLRSLRKSYGNLEVVHGIDLDVAHNEFVVLVGPSGCGKSTTLRMIAGLEDISDGEIWIGEKLVNEFEPKDRDIAMVFQDYALYPHMSVFDNIAFSLQTRKLSKDQIRELVHTAADTLDIQDLLERRPKQLSGGQRQRVAMGRAIVRDPKVFLFDEPLSNLDAKLRVSMRSEIKKLHRRIATTIVYVTHDQVEAMTLADRIVVMHQGHIEQIGTPDEIYSQPASLFVAGFMGSPAMNLIPAMIAKNATDYVVRLQDETELAIPKSIRNVAKDNVGREIVLGLRAEAFKWARSSKAKETIQAVATEVEPLGSDTLVYFQIADKELVCRLPPKTVRAPGDAFLLAVNMNEMHLFDPQTTQAL